MEKRVPAPYAATRNRRVRQKVSWKRRIKTFFALVFMLVFSGLAIATIFFVTIFLQVSKTIPPLGDLMEIKPTEASVIYYSDGAKMAVLATENHYPVKLEQISPHLLAATVAAEDKRFYEHKGVDYQGVARAIYLNVKGGDLTGQGASTITQQLARNVSELGLTKKKVFRRKVAEAIIAMRLEKSYTKEEILELYLNQIYYGNGAYGIEAASRTYFHKKAKDLSLGQAAYLAGLPQRPAEYSSNREAATHRRNWILDRMEEDGKITADQHAAALKEPIKIFKPKPRINQVLGSPYVVNYVVSRLEEKYGRDSVYSGWKIYTTIDSRIQKEAEESLINGLHKYSEYANQGALVCLDPKTGYIRAMVGGTDFKRDSYNVILQGRGRPPGSTFKPIVYIAAFDTGTASLYKSYRDDPNLGESTEGGWHPKNYSGGYKYAPMTVMSAIKFSTNTVAVKTALETGLPTVISYAHKLGITSDIKPYAPIALGPVAVRPIELCSAYGAFANEGKRAEWMAIEKVVKSDGTLLYENQIKLADTGIKPESIQQLDQALREVVLHGTGTEAASVPEARGKTGTTSDNRDNWFAGYTPELVTVIWAAHEQRKNGRVVKYLEMPGATGGHVCAPIWRDFMLKAVPIQQEYNQKHAPKKEVVPIPTTEAKVKKKSDSIESNETQIPVPTDGEPDDTPSDTQKPTAPDAPTEPVDELPPPNRDPVMTVPPTREPGAVRPPGASPSVTPPGPRASAPLVSPSRTGGIAAPPRPSEPTEEVRQAPPPRRADPRDEMVTVTVCADSGKRATKWCDATVTRTLRRRDAPRGVCTLHRPPAGERDQ